MRDFCFLLFVLFMPIFPAIAYAESPPPAKLADTKAEPSCITVNPSWVGSQPANWGTGSKGPAVQLKNNCPNEAIITGFEIGLLDAPALSPVRLIEGSATYLEEGTVKYRHFIFADSDENCAAEKVETFIFGVEKQLAEKNYARYRETQIILKKKPSTLEEFVERQMKFEAGGKISSIEIACKQIRLPPEGTVTLPVEWNRAYVVRGQLANDTKTSLLVEGKMLDPR